MPRYLHPSAYAAVRSLARGATRPRAPRPPRVAARVRAYAPGRHRRPVSPPPPVRPRPLPPRRTRPAAAPAPVTLRRVLDGLQRLEVAA